jgi:hypothetical protein
MSGFRHMRGRRTGRWAAVIARVTGGAAAALQVARGDKAALDVACTLTRLRDAGVWVMVDLVVRNLYPHDLHVVELEVLRPRRAQIWTDEEDRFWSLAFLAPSLGFEPRANINATVKPKGMAPDYLRVGSTQIPLSEGDALSRRFWIRLPRRGTARIKMALKCELKAPVAKSLKITIKSAIPTTGEDR